MLPGRGPDDPLPEPIFRASPADQVADELQFHIDMRARELIARGVAPDVARHMARDRFDDLDRVSLECRQLAEQRENTVRQTRYLTNFLQDIQFAFRMLGKRPAFAVMAIVPLGFGIGAATAMYSVVDGAMLRPLPFADPGRLVAVWTIEENFKKTSTTATFWDRVPVDQLAYAALRDRATHLHGIALWTKGQGATLIDRRGTAPTTLLRATSSLLPLLGARPAVGRGFLAGEDTFNGPRIAMLSWELWQNRFGGDSAIVGGTIALDDRQYTVVGILPPGLRLDRTAPITSIWIPALQDSSDRVEQHNRSYRALARLAPGATIAQATDEVNRIERDVNGWRDIQGLGARVENWRSDQVRDVQTSLWILFSAVGLLLLIACANVATLMLGEAARREPEIAARSALGAGPLRLARQLLTESIVIAGIGTMVGTGLAWIGIKALVVLAPPRIPGLDTTHLNWRVLSFAAACTLLTGITFGLGPALALARFGRHSTVRIGAGQTSRGTAKLQRALIAAEVALSLVLLVSCTMLGRSFVRLSEVNPGFLTADETEVQLRTPNTFWRDEDAARAYFRSALREIAAIPGVTAVSGSSNPPFSLGMTSSAVMVEGKTYPPGDNGLGVQQHSVLPDYFRTMGIPILAGRAFDPADRENGPLVVIISESAAHRDWPDGSPIGRRLFWQGKWRTVVGIASDVRQGRLSRDVEPTLYAPFDQEIVHSITLLIRATGAPATVATAVRHRIETLGAGVVVASVDPLPALIERSYGEERFRALLGSLFGVLAGILAASGIFGVVSRTVARRMREAGIRRALGAPTRALSILMMQETLVSVALGLTLGFPIALLAGHFLAPYLFGVSPHDPIAFGLGSLLLIGASVLATLPPARRAGRVDPVVVLRSE